MLAARLLGVVIAVSGMRSPDLVTPCLAELRRQPTSLQPYQCLMGAAARGHASEVKGVLRRTLRLQPENPRPIFYLALLRDFAGELVPEGDFRRAVQGFRREGDTVGLVYALTSLVGNSCFSHRQCDPEAEDFLTEAERIAEASSSNHLRRLVQLFWLRLSFHDDEIARAERADARLGATPDDDPDWLAPQVFEARARLAYELNNFDQEYSLYSEMLKRSVPGTVTHATALGGVAEAAAHLALRNREDSGAAQALLRRALAEQRDSHLSLSMIGNGTLRTVENLALLLGTTDESIRLLEDNLAAYQHQRGWGGMDSAFNTQWMLAQYLVDGARTDSARALALVDQTEERASEKGFAWEHAHALLVRAYVLWKSGQRQDAERAAESSLRELEKLRSEQEDINVRIRYEDTLAYVYELIAGLTLDPRFGAINLADVESSFAITERMRARVLLEEILGRNRATARWQIEQTALQRRIRVSHEKLMDPETPLDVRSGAVTELRKSERQLVDLRATEAGALRNQPVFPSLPQIQAALTPQEALVSFQVWNPNAALDASFVEGRSWATVITKAAIHVVQIPNANQLETRVNFFESVLQHRDDSYRIGSVLLYSALMEPVVGVLDPGIKDLILIPDGSLHRLPFDALRASLSGPFLAERFRVSLAPSAAIWLSLRGQPRTRAGLALVLAKPDLVANSTEGQWTKRSDVLGELVRANDEGLQAVHAFPAGSVLLSEASASRNSLVGRDLSRFSLLHFATHSVVDPLAPEKSAILLAKGSPDDDGRFGVDDISRLSLAGKTVILASCSTSAGLVYRSEGLMSLSRPFLGVGAQAVVGTLQPVRDAESFAFFDAFYSSLKQGVSVGDALGEAKRARIRNGAPPAAWASFVLLGDGLATPRAPDPSQAAMVVGLLFGAAATAALGLRLRRWSRTRAQRLGAAAASGVRQR